MAKLEKALKEIIIYQDTIRHPNLKKLEVSGLYDLFPKNESEYKIENFWPKQWTFCGSAGIYLFLDENLEIAYIGKANHFGNRFGKYFPTGNNGECNFKHTWKTIPRYVVTVAVPQTSKFENSSLEGYLLSKIITTDNTAENNREK